MSHFEVYRWFHSYIILTTYTTQGNSVRSRPSPPGAFGPKASSRRSPWPPRQSRVFWRSPAQCKQPWLQTVSCSNCNTGRETASQEASRVYKISAGVRAEWGSSPQTVIETLHAVLGHAIWATEWADPPKHAGNVHHSAPGHLDERQDAQGDINNSTQIDGQHEFIILNGEPVSRARWHRDACVVHNSPETYSNTTTTVQLSLNPNMEPLH